MEIPENAPVARPTTKSSRTIPSEVDVAEFGRLLIGFPVTNRQNAARAGLSEDVSEPALSGEPERLAEERHFVRFPRDQKLGRPVENLPKNHSERLPPGVRFNEVGQEPSGESTAVGESSIRRRLKVEDVVSSADSLAEDSARASDSPDNHFPPKGLEVNRPSGPTVSRVASPDSIPVPEPAHESPPSIPDSKNLASRLGEEVNVPQDSDQPKIGAARSLESGLGSIPSSAVSQTVGTSESLNESPVTIASALLGGGPANTPSVGANRNSVPEASQPSATEGSVDHQVTVGTPTPPAEPRHLPPTQSISVTVANPAGSLTVSSQSEGTKQHGGSPTTGEVKTGTFGRGPIDSTAIVQNTGPVALEAPVEQIAAKAASSEPVVRSNDPIERDQVALSLAGSSAEVLAVGAPKSQVMGGAIPNEPGPAMKQLLRYVSQLLQSARFEKNAFEAVIRSEILPATTLRVELQQGQLVVRFSTSSPEAFAILAANENLLRKELFPARKRSGNIEIIGPRQRTAMQGGVDGMQNEELVP